MPFLQAETTEIERIDDGLSNMNDVLLAGVGWHVLQHQQAARSLMPRSGAI